MSEAAILSLFFKDRDCFERYSTTIPSHLLEPEAAVLLADLKDWYDMHPSKKVDLRAFWEWFKIVQHPSYQADKLRDYHTIIQTISKFPEHDLTANEIIKTLVLREAAAKIATMADAYASGESKDFFNELPDLWEAAAKEADILNDNDSEVTADIGEILDEIANLGTGLSWRTKIFDTAAGPIRGGDFIVLAAYVDSGKTSLLASEVTYMAHQLPDGHKVLWFNNEERGSKVKGRLYSAALGYSNIEMRDLGYENVKKEYTDYMKGDPDKIILVDNANITPALVRRKLRQYKAGLVVFDQLHKLQGKLNEFGQNKVDRLSAVFQFGREIAKTYNVPVITTHQARGASALEQDQNRKQGKEDNYLEMYQLANSREAIQAEADLIVTVGRNPEDESSDLKPKRYFHFAKNKMPTPGNPDHRNLRTTLRFDRERVRFT